MAGISRIIRAVADMYEAFEKPRPTVDVSVVSLREVACAPASPFAIYDRQLPDGRVVSGEDGSMPNA